MSTPRSGIKNILKKHQIKPLKKLGQRFLIDELAVKKVILAAKLEPKDIVVEIGPGTGILTKELAKRVKKVIAVEKDKRMCELLQENIKGFNNVKVIHKDILEFGIWNLFGNWKLEIGNFKIVANLPFYLTAPVIRKFLEAEIQPESMVLVVQKEVAQRICSKPPKMSLLAVSVQFYAEPKIISYVSKKSFWPQPKVDSAIIKIVPLGTGKLYNNYTPDELLYFRSLFFKVVRAGFLSPRKQLINNLSKGLKLDKQDVTVWLLKNNIKPEQRAESLTIENWITLAKSYTIN